MMDTTYRRILDTVTEKVHALAPRLPYHNVQHMDDVAQWVEVIGRGEGVSEQHLYLLKIASKLHDIVYDPAREDNEEQSAKLSERILAQAGLGHDDCRIVSRLIIATKYPTHPQGILERVLCDADMTNPGTDRFFVQSELRRQELGIPEKTYYTEYLPAFLEQVRWYTPTAQRLFSRKKEENEQRLDESIRRWRP
jgi:predicted metal-dependent HD superfamily phosphohydrolase